MLKKPLKKLTSRDLAFGIGRPATSDELKELLSRPFGKGKDGKKLVKDIADNLKARKDKRKAS